MSTQSKRAAELERKIRSAFDAVPYPGDNRIVEYSDWESEEIAGAFRGRSWKDMPVDFLCPRYKESLYLLTPEAYRFYLPAYLIAAIDYERSDIIPDVVISTLTPRMFRDQRGDLRLLQRLTVFGREETDAIRLFLEFMRDEHGNSYPDDEPGQVLRLLWATATPRVHDE